MSRMTITEGLAEIKTLKRRLEKKREFVFSYLMRGERFKDPLEKDGGSVIAIQNAMQSMGDLQKRIVDIRLAIQEANAETVVTVNSKENTVAKWLVWRRDIAPEMRQFNAKLTQQINAARADATRRGVTLSNEPLRPEDIVINLSEQGLAKQIEDLEETLGALDGQLSLKNATTFIEV